MIERKLPRDPVSATQAWHKDRPGGRHLEQAVHHGRMHAAARLVRELVMDPQVTTVVDLGAGDGGMLQLIGPLPGITCYGFDFTPQAVARAVQHRMVTVHYANFLELDTWTDEPAVIVATEVIEHLADPHGFLARCWQDPNVRSLVASSPWVEAAGDGPGMEGHLWAWDTEGYERLIGDAGFTIRSVEVEGIFTVISATKGSA